ncbi:MAG: DUF169 domain-containing protein, partial [Holophagales bacterium]|nr:DUF169 domain-containing protein [Holophagales bacterium]
MKTQLEQAIELKYPPLAIFFSQELPEDAQLPSPVCAMLLVAQAAKGKAVAMSHDSCSCSGAASGFGLEQLNLNSFPGGTECFLRFLTVGNKYTEQGRAVITQLKEHSAPKIFLEEFSEGEGFLKTTELAQEWVNSLPTPKPEGPYVIIKPLKDVKPYETPKVVTLLVNADQLSALVVLANYARHGSDNVKIPFGAGCNC